MDLHVGSSISQAGLVPTYCPVTLSFEELLVSRNAKYKDLNRITGGNQNLTCIVKTNYYSEVHNTLFKLASLVE